jgi:predicted lipoprotein with Yx(FWY)xxD motif
MKRKIIVFVSAAAVFAVVVVAGCSSGSGSAYSAASGDSAVRASAATSATAAKVGVANSPLGRIVVDGNGRTLYLYEKDKNRRSSCSGQCATYWPPLLSQGKPLARPGIKQSLLGTTRRANGREQATYAGHPLYRFLGDKRPGQTTGEGSHTFGGGWDALSPAGNKIETDG